MFCWHVSRMLDLQRITRLKDKKRKVPGVNKFEIRLAGCPKPENRSVKCRNKLFV